MPRAKAADAEETTPKKAAARKPRARATNTKAKPARRTVARKAAADTTPRVTRRKKTPAAAKPVRRRTARVTEDDPDVLTATAEPAEAAPARKAPTAFAGLAEQKKRQRMQVMIVGALLTVGLGGSAVVGFADSDAGRIDVAQTIQERNERMANLVDVDGPVTVVAPQVNAGDPALPDGGLIGLQPAAPTPPPAPAATSTTASSTATSTPSGTNASSTSTSTPPVETNFITQTATTTVTATSSRSSEPDLADTTAI